MKVTIVQSTFGILAFGDENRPVATTLFPKKPQVAATNLFKIEGGKATNEVYSLIKALKEKGYDRFVFENAPLAKEVEAKAGVQVEVVTPSEAGELLRSQPDKFAVKAGFVKDLEEFSLWTHNVTIELTKLRVRGAVEKRDLVVAQAIQSLDELDKTINMLMARVREWYGIHFPEMDRLLDKHETYARLVVDLGSRDNFSTENLEKEDVTKSKAEAIAKVAEQSMGADLEETDLKQIQTLCKDILSLYKLRDSLEKYLDSTMEEVAPNIKFLVGSLLGARLIAVSGGLINLAKRPASTIQVLGAEKALFRSLKTGTRPPKHGLIFQHTLLHDAKRWQRGKIARAIAGKLAIAARADAFGGRNIAKELKIGMDKRVEEIHQKYDQPPPLPPPKPRREQPRYERPRHEKRGKFRRER
ncbi:MAG TPA: C/D box methylation guide ribonucleoprotein complex aNOP56 subunit [Candidatus Bathyarchaeia archaeon]|nr:C/D box methylation guide ribonucleoprotein complex aNOP56 subunit [Candidatus Bathyarchaeia archaeon]